MSSSNCWNNIKIKVTKRQLSSCQSWVYTQSEWSQSNKADKRLSVMVQHSIWVVPVEELPVMVECRQGFGAEGCYLLHLWIDQAQLAGQGCWQDRCPNDSWTLPHLHTHCYGGWLAEDWTSDFLLQPERQTWLSWQDLVQSAGQVSLHMKGMV